MNKKLLALFAMMLAAASAVATDEDPASTSLDEEVLGSSKSSSNSEDMEAAAAEAMFDVGDLEYEDEDTSSDDEEGVRRYLRANGMGGGLQKMTKVIGYKCKPSCMKKFSKCRTRCKVGNGNTRCVGGHLPGKCKNNCCRLKSSNGGSGSASGNGGKFKAFFGIPGTSPFLYPPPYCPNGSWHSTDPLGMGPPCMATQFPIMGVKICPSGTIGSFGGALCVVW